MTSMAGILQQLCSFEADGRDQQVSGQLHEAISAGNFSRVSDTIRFFPRGCLRYARGLGCDLRFRAWSETGTAWIAARTRARSCPAHPSYQVPLARAAKATVRVPVIAVGLITEFEQAEAIVLRHKAAKTNKSTPAPINASTHTRSRLIQPRRRNSSPTHS
jgi:hypothetical protein